MSVNRGWFLPVKVMYETPGRIEEFEGRPKLKLWSLQGFIRAQDLALKDVEPGCRTLAAVLKTVLTKKEAARVEKKARDIKGFEAVISVIKPALRSQKLARKELLVRRSIANAQKILLERHEGNSFRSYASLRERATLRKASGILEFSPRKDWKAAHAVMSLCGMLYRESLNWIDAAVLTAEEVIEYRKRPERSVEAIKDVKRCARVDPEYAEQGETQRWRTEHLFDANIKNERQWKAVSQQVYRELLDDSDPGYDISGEQLGHYDGCIDCYDCEDEDEVEDYIEDEEMPDQN